MLRSHTTAPQSTAANGCGLAIAMLLLCAGCDEDDELRGTSIRGRSTVGLFEPGDPPDVDADVQGPPRVCDDPVIPASDAGVDLPGTLTVTFTTQPPPGAESKYDLIPGERRTFGAVWVEDDIGRFVKTLEQWGTKVFVFGDISAYFRRRPLTNCPIDVMSKATLTAHIQHVLPWDGKDLNGHVVKDGTYKLRMQVAIDSNLNHAMPPLAFDIVKGRMPWTLSPLPEPPQTGMTISYVPGP
jgi:hypothetical protein